jgi:uncharacterized protein
MHTETLSIASGAPGVSQHLRVWRFGTPGRGPKATIQAALHADEVPGVLVAHRLRERLAALEATGALAGEVVLVPYANPLGLTQWVLGHHHGRFDLRDGANFNRCHPDLSRTAGDAVAAQIGSDAAANVAAIRSALVAAAAALASNVPAQDLKNKLVQLAIDSDVVLDLHCDGQAAMHLYSLTPQADIAHELGALLGAHAVLLATESGDSPFDEACSRPWLLLQQRFAPHPVPLACFSATVELRGEADTSHALAAQDAEAIIEFLRRRGVVGGTPAPLPPAHCEPTPLAGSEPIHAPHAGIVVFEAAPGRRLAAGDAVATLLEPASGRRTVLRTEGGGLMYARIATRWAAAGQRLAKVAGRTLRRSGKLLSA